MSVEAVAFSEIVNAEYPRFTKVAAKILRHRAEAEDAVQEGLRKALNNLDQFRGDCEFLEWLIRIFINECLQSRKQGRVLSRHFASLSMTGRNAQHQLSLTTANPEAALIRNNTAQVLTIELRHLPPLFTDVLELHDVRELSMRDVASSLRVAIEAAKSRLQRARIELRRRVSNPPLYRH